MSGPLTSWGKLPGMFIAVVEEIYHTNMPKALDLALKGVYARGTDRADIRHLKNIPFVRQILVRAYLIFLIGTVIVEHTDLNRYDGSVSFVQAYHIYVFVSVCTHIIPIRILPVTAL